MLKLYAMGLDKKLNLSAFILGLTSMIGQIIILRELIVVFYGNELSLGVILASWLFWVGFGGFLAGRFVDRLRQRERLLSNIQVLTSIILPLEICLIRNIKSILMIPAGKIIGVMPMLGSSFLSLSVICILLGFTFTLISRVYAEKNRIPAKGIGRIYLMEGLGAGIGGLIYSFFLIKALSVFQNVFIVACLNLSASLLFNKNLIQVFYLIILSLSFIFNWPSYLERYTRQSQFRPFEVIESRDSIYGNITVTRSGKAFSFYENGLLLFTSGDLLTSERAVHYALLEHPMPRKILLIGGGISGSLKEILKYHVKKVDYVELDPLIIKLGEKYLGPIKDPRVNIINMDGRLFVKQYYSRQARRISSGRTHGPAEGRGRELTGYDVIILDLPDPYTAMLNRFYSLEFFKEVKGILAPGGIFSFRLSSSENYINPEQSYYLASIYNTLKKEFRDIKIFPGDNATFLASNKAGVLTYDPRILIQRLKERGIQTRFVREYYLPFKLDPMRIQYLQRSIRESRDAKINKDFKPIGYFYYILLWVSLFLSGRGLLPYLNKIDLNLFILILTGLALLAFLIQRLRKSSFKTPVAVSIATTGMSEISFQIIVILAFQFLYGYIYYKIGVILSSFMIGLVIGAFLINRQLDGLKDERSLYLKTQVFICLYPLILPLILTYIAKSNLTGAGLAANTLELSFAWLPIIAGFLGGFQFPLATKICLKGSKDTVGKTVGFLYGADLLGSCIGGVLVGLLFVPILGIIQTCVLVSIINIFVLILLSTARI